MTGRQRWHRPGWGDVLAALALLPAIVVLDRLALTWPLLKAAAGLLIAAGSIAFVLSLSPNPNLLTRRHARRHPRRHPR